MKRFGLRRQFPCLGYRSRLVISVSACVLAMLSAVVYSPVEGRALTEVEMAATFGDGNCPCKKPYSCKNGFSSGSTDCEYCDDLTAIRDVCCPLGIRTQCEYGTAPVCQDTDHYIGPRNGPVATCSTCATAQAKKDGKCTNLTKPTAASDFCPGFN
jgi:hypothetical protein